MQWTPEHNALLNQCVFASGYDFDAASELFRQQAIALRLWTVEDELGLSANQCQEQWMALNPTEEDEEFEEQEDKSAERSVVESPETTTDVEEDGYVVVPDGGPRLKLSLSDAELDLLLNTLPPSEELEDTNSPHSADAKDRPPQPRSEMQWVLAFLTDPDAIASVDAEAKNLMGSNEKHDDDNYQVFLKDLEDANLIAPAPISAGDGKLGKNAQKQEMVAANGTEDSGEDSSDESDSEWERTRHAIKHSVTLR